MNDKNQEFKRELSVKWVKGTTGTSYLCPTEALKRLDNPEDKVLQTICVDESDNPQND